LDKAPYISWTLNFFWTCGYMLLKFGFQSMKQTIAGGQNSYPEGLFYSGKTMEEGPRKIYQWFRENIVNPKYIVVQDIHTGLGPYGYDSHLVSPDRFREDFIKYLDHLSMITEKNKGIGYITRGGFESYFEKLYPDAYLCQFTQEFGTRHALLVLKALREENFYHHEDVPMTHWSKVKLLNTFSPNENKWKNRIIERGEYVFLNTSLKYLQDVEINE